MRVFLAVTAAAALALTGCIPEPAVKAGIVVCPAEPVRIERRDGTVIECPNPPDVLEGRVKDAYVAYLACRALFHAQRDATAACRDEAEEIEP